MEIQNRQKLANGIKINCCNGYSVITINWGETLRLGGPKTPMF